MAPTWSVGSRPKSNGGLVITYRLEEASAVDMVLSRSLRKGEGVQEENVEEQVLRRRMHVKDDYAKEKDVKQMNIRGG